ncbi:MAG: AmmeMemoRadiSam system protein B [Nitrospira sp.]|nr:AmmeMemoRadiSam system protein B [Nitrospira sp.]
MTERAKDPNQYPLLRNLQFSPLRQQDEQYIMLWDASGISADKLIIPLSYFFIIQHFDGEHSLEQVATLYLKRFGEFLSPGRLSKLVADLNEKLFLEGERFAAAKAAAKAAYRDAPVRKAAYAGKSYPGDSTQLLAQLESFYSSKEGPEIRPSANRGKRMRGLVAPHHEMRDAGPLYAWAYKELKEAVAPNLVVVLGTCHAGLENLYALTDKDFETPLGLVRVDRDILDWFRKHGSSTYFDEELNHQYEHTIEFQLPFLQHTLGPDAPFTIVPILCAFPPAYVADPASQPVKDKIEAFIQTMKEGIAASGKEPCIVASAELAHIGMRYGDSDPPSDFTFHRCMQADLAMLKHVEEVDPEAFARFILKENDERRIFGFAPIYTMLRLIQAAKGEVLRYDRAITDQFNSTVTYASMAFF